jgi:hypothetical protein
MSSLRKGFMGIKYDKDMADDHDNNEYQKYQCNDNYRNML